MRAARRTGLIARGSGRRGLKTSSAPQLPWRSAVEVDLVGDREMRADARYGVHALRAAENFARPRAQLLRDVPELYRAFGMVKLAAARANLRDAAHSRPRSVRRSIAAAEELIADRSDLSADLIVPLVQGGAGTSTNMNVNEVLANRALELLGHAPGDYRALPPQRPRQSVPVDQRRLSDRDAHRADLALGGC